MSEVFRCDDKDTLVAYLYGELEASGRREVERHLRTCMACTREVDGLQGVRQDLQLWTPPDAELGFTIVPRAAAPSATVLTSSRWASLQALPRWAQAAAALLVVAAAAAIANVQVRSTSEGVVVTTGWMRPAAVEQAVPAAVPARNDDEWRQALVSLEQSLREEFRSELTNHESVIRTAAAAPAAGANADAAAVLRRVQSMIEASEERQRQEMAVRFAQADRMWNTRWASDRATLSRHLGSLQGRTMAVQAGQQEIMNSIRLQRVAAPQPNQ
jgi:anti-sigma factor ChrR (cupin superfamily)